jgi:hypothetical protein
MKKVLFLMHLQNPGKNEYSPAIFNWYGILEKMGYQVFYHEYSDFNIDEFYTLIKDNKPDFIFHPTYDYIHTEFIKLREFSKVFVIHSDDDWRFNNYAKFWIPFTDGAIGYQNDKSSYVQCDAPENYYYNARWTFNPNTMYFKFDKSKLYNISHVGKLHGKKDESLKQVEKSGYSVSKVDPNFNSYKDYMECFNKSIISLCFTSNVLGTAKQSKTRLGEMPFYCILASEVWPKMELWNMEPNKNFILIDESKNFVNVIDKILKDDDFKKSMFESGKNILLSKNTVFHEWNNIMSQFDPDFKRVNVELLLKSEYKNLYE